MAPKKNSQKKAPSHADRMRNRRQAFIYIMKMTVLFNQSLVHKLRAILSSNTFYYFLIYFIQLFQFALHTHTVSTVLIAYYAITDALEQQTSKILQSRISLLVNSHFTIAHRVEGANNLHKVCVCVCLSLSLFPVYPLPKTNSVGSRQL